MSKEQNILQEKFTGTYGNLDINNMHVYSQDEWLWVSAKVGTTGLCDGDAGHGGRTYLRLNFFDGTAASCRINNKDIQEVRQLELILGGDFELQGLINSLEFAAKILKDIVEKKEIVSTIVPQTIDTTSCDRNLTPKPVLYEDIRYRSKTEAKWARVFNKLGIPFQYEAYRYRLDPQHLLEMSSEVRKNLARDGYIYYIPDFYLPTYDLFVEIKGKEPNGLEEAKAMLLSRKAPVIMFCGGLPTSSLLKAEEGIPETGYLYTFKDVKYERQEGALLSACSYCGSIGFSFKNAPVIYNCKCNNEVYKSAYTTCIADNIIEAYEDTYFYTFEEIKEEIPFPDLPIEDIR